PFQPYYPFNSHLGQAGVSPPMEKAQPIAGLGVILRKGINAADRHLRLNNRVRVARGSSKVKVLVLRLPSSRRVTLGGVARNPRTGGTVESNCQKSDRHYNWEKQPSPPLTI